MLKSGHGDDLQLWSEVASIVAVAIAVAAIALSVVLAWLAARQAARERRYDFELGLIKEMSVRVELGIGQADLLLATYLRILGYDEFPSITLGVEETKASPAARDELHRARLRDPGTDNIYQLTRDNGVEYQGDMRREIDEAIRKRLNLRGRS